MVKAKAAPEFRRKNRVQAVAGVLDGLLDGPALGKGSLQAGILMQVQRRWRSLCPMLGEQSWPVGINSTGVLRVAVANSSVANELKYMAPTVIDAANMLAGYGAVQKVVAVVQPLPAPVQKNALPPPPAPLAESIAASARLCKGVADTDLRAALSKLGAWVLNANTREKK